MTTYCIDPLDDPRWSALVNSHPSASVFHTTAWLSALERVYGYRSVVVTTSPPTGSLENGIVFADVASWLTGRRFVSLPFSDHCEPLIDRPTSQRELLEHLTQAAADQALRYVELRHSGALSMRERMRYAEPFVGHRIDLRSGPAGVYQRFHKDSVRRRIQRAERQGVVYESGSDERLLREFHKLMVRTRRRHGIPAQTIAWFSALLSGAGTTGRIHIARFQQRAVAAMLTLRHRDTLVFKYGASDERWHQLGAVPFLFWRVIQQASSHGCCAMDLGHSETEHRGLIVFKDRLGADRYPLWHSRWSSLDSSQPLRRIMTPRTRRLLSHLPERCCVMAGRLLYRHVG